MHRDDPAAMSVDERLDEITSLLADGFLRLKRRTGCLLRDTPSSPDSATSESAESSRIPADWSCHLSENSPSLVRR